MFHYTACRSCGGILHTTDGDTVHPRCQPQPTKPEQLAQAWLAAVETGATTLEQRLQTQIDALDNRPPRLLDAALQYAAWGWPVFPLQPRGKQPATAHGFKDATVDPDRIRAWWTRSPDANIGLPTGQRFDVIDIDTPDGPITYTQLLAEENPATGVGVIPDTHGHAATASGGLHLYVLASGAGNTTRIAPGVDYRGKGGYVVAPPSTLGQPGRSWSWIEHPSPVLTGVGDTYGK